MAHSNSNFTGFEAVLVRKVENRKDTLMFILGERCGVGWNRVFGTSLVNDVQIMHTGDLRRMC